MMRNASTRARARIQRAHALKCNLNRSAGIGIPFLHPRTGDTRLIRVRPDVAPGVDGKQAKD